MASSAAASGSSSGAARKARPARRPRPSRAARQAASAPAPAPAGAAGWVGVRQRLWGGYAAEIRIPSSRKRVWIGRFEHAVQAAVAYDAAMFLFYGKVLPKLRRYNFPAAPRPAVSEFIRPALTVANVKAIAEDHARRFGRFFAPLPPPADVNPVVPTAPPTAVVIPVSAPPPPQVAAAGGAAACAGGGVVAVDATVAGAGVAVGASVAGAGPDSTTGGAGHGDDELYIDADILTAADLQFSFSGKPDDDFVNLMEDMDMDLIFGEI